MLRNFKNLQKIKAITFGYYYCTRSDDIPWNFANFENFGHRIEKIEYICIRTKSHEHSSYFAYQNKYKIPFSYISHQKIVIIFFTTFLVKW